MDSALHILEIIVGVVILVFCTAAVPFAFRVTAQLATIVAELKGLLHHEAAQDRDIATLRKDVTDLRAEQSKLRTNLAR
jgi:hypothetical protein